jgi:hypothetical protein
MPAIAFVPIALCAVMIAALAPTLPIGSGGRDGR